MKIWNFQIFSQFFVFSENLKFSDFYVFSDFFWKSEIFRNFMNFSYFFWKSEIFRIFLNFSFFSENLIFSDFFWIFQICSENIIFNLNLNLIRIWNFQNFSDLHHSWSVDVHGKSPRALVKNVWQQRRKKWARENMLFGTFFLYYWRMGKRLQTFSICKVQGSRLLRLFFVI